MDELSSRSVISALINMLDDPDEKVFTLIREKLLQFGKPVIRMIDDALDNCFDETLEGRMVALRDDILMQDLNKELVQWRDHDGDNLLRGFILVSSLDDRNLDEVEIRSMIAQIKTDVWIELHEGLTALENIKVINHVLFRIHKFEGNKDDFAAAENSYIQWVLKNRKGSPLTLGMIYLIIARQLGLPVFGVNLPQHFILTYLNRQEIENPAASDVMFYINPFNNGTMFSRHEIDQYITQLKIKSEPSFYKPCSNQDIIRRLLQNLLFAFRTKGPDYRVQQIEKLLNIFS
jgi:regulator of sirC expression with transglutaminase-like and TPR domain